MHLTKSDPMQGRSWSDETAQRNRPPTHEINMILPLHELQLFGAPSVALILKLCNSSIQLHQRFAILTQDDFGTLIYCCSPTIYLTPTDSITPLTEAWNALFEDASHHIHTTLVMIPNILQFLPNGTCPASRAVTAVFASFGYRVDGVSNH